VLANLITNAIKYTVEPGTLTVTLSSTGSAHTVAVSDTGIGIPAEDLANLFTRYGRGKAEQVKKIQGTGLGLLIVKQIVEAHKGRVWVKSEHGKGSTFAFELPPRVRRRPGAASPGSAPCVRVVVATTPPFRAVPVGARGFRDPGGGPRLERGRGHGPWCAPSRHRHHGRRDAGAGARTPSRRS
jgi:hypothetical protein